MQEHRRDAGRARVRWSESGPFGIVPAWVIDAEISDRAVRLYALLARLAGSPEAATFRGQAELERSLRCGRTAIKAALRELREIGAVSVEERVREDGGRASNLYLVHALPEVEQGSQGRPTPVAEATGRPVAEATDSKEEDPVEREGSSYDEPPGVPATRPSEAPKLVRVEGRDLAFDAVCEVTGIDPRNPRRAAEVATALNGNRRTRPPTPGIRDLFWQEISDAHEQGIEIGALGGQLPRAPYDLPELVFVSSSGAATPAFEQALAATIRVRAALYRRKMPGATLTPTALAKWWLDLPGMPTPGEDGTLSPEEILRRSRLPEIE